MSKPEFVYTTFIHTTPEFLWRGLTDPAFTRQYRGGTAFETDWNPGSAMTWVLGGDVRIAHPDQIILEPGSTVLKGISDGWPRLVSDLKTLLEKVPVA